MLRRITFGCLAFRCRPCVSDGEERIATRIATAPNLWVFWAAQRGHPRTPTDVENDTGGQVVAGNAYPLKWTYVGQVTFVAVGPVGGVDYPRTYQEFRAWFPDDASCADYLARLR